MKNVVLRKFGNFTLVFFLICSFGYGQNETKSYGHSHNDYLQDRPLLAALENGMMSIEIDVILKENQVIVSHDDEHYDMSNTIDALYFKPIQKLIKKRGGALSKERHQIQLLIDLKTEGVSMLDKLHEVVSKYNLLFDKRGLDKKWSPLQIVLSGEVDKSLILGQKAYPYFHVDGRCKDVKKRYASYEMPLISEKYTKLFTWNGQNKRKKREERKLRKLVRKVHGQGKKLRFWATMDNEEMWDYLINNGVDYINVDNLERFSTYIATHHK